MTPQEFIDALTPDVIRDQVETGVLASITIAQAALETGYGKYAKGNNLFGIKATGIDEEALRHSTSEYLNGRWVEIVDGFRVYNSWTDSVKDHSLFLQQNQIYARAGFFERSRELDYQGAARALQAAGYATDPQYAAKLISIIERYRLYELDVQAAEEGGWIPMRLEHDWQWKQLGDALDGLYKKGLLTDYRWAERAYRKDLTVTEVAWLSTVVLARQNGVNA
ncbi:glycoside hydrolase family 73 protein [Paenibacillus sp. GD4]|uniref:glycoside hydrolase family 73 protein n=1 Tax=Paenibacillus sp. GD4 TaxID=3068890 RepID=UPI0027968A65|nr:glycoside hydrolase family 73 protein [Paenibacillus sp. GD4]MDQ1909626.1 glycoside hydrolase family 73 protein [Paenibacillus sp. GD4]